MKKNNILCGLLCANVFFFNSVSAQAAAVNPEESFTDGWYAGAAVGFTGSPNTVTAIPSLSLGYQKSGWRLEEELGYIKQFDLKSGINYGNTTTKSTASMALTNVYYDFAMPGKKLTPFLGIGAGFINEYRKDYQQGNLIKSGDYLTGVAQATAGVRYRLSDKLSLTASFRYLSLLEAPKVGNATGSLGLLYRF